MITTEKVKKTNERLEALKKLTLEKYLDEIDDLNSDMLLDDVMFHHLVNNDFADDYQFPCLEGISKDEKKKAMELVDDYKHLCFYEGSEDYWFDSIETIKNSDYDLIAGKLLDNYEFLISLALEGDKELFENLDKLKDVDGYRETSVIEYLRNTFSNDELLCKILLNMSSKNSLFKVFTDGEKASLLKYPEGTLYLYDSDSIKIVSPLYLACEICNNLDYDYNLNDEDIEEVALDVTKKLRDVDDEDFKEVVSSMSDNYLDDFSIDLMDNRASLPILNDDGSFSKRVWTKEKKVIN